MSCLRNQPLLPPILSTDLTRLCNFYTCYTNTINVHRIIIFRYLRECWWIARYFPEPTRHVGREAPTEPSPGGGGGGGRLGFDNRSRALRMRSAPWRLSISVAWRYRLADLPTAARGDRSSITVYPWPSLSAIVLPHVDQLQVDPKKSVRISYDRSFFNTPVGLSRVPFWFFD